MKYKYAAVVSNPNTNKICILCNVEIKPKLEDFKEDIHDKHNNKILYGLKLDIWKSNNKYIDIFDETEKCRFINFILERDKLIYDFTEPIEIDGNCVNIMYEALAEDTKSTATAFFMKPKKETKEIINLNAQTDFYTVLERLKASQKVNKKLAEILMQKDLKIEAIVILLEQFLEPTNPILKSNIFKKLKEK